MNGIDTTGTFTQGAFNYAPPLPGVAPGPGVITNAQFALQALQSGQVPKEQVSSWVASIHSQLISLFGTDDKSLKQYQGQAQSLGEQIQAAANAVLAGPDPATPDTTTTPGNPPGTVSVDSPTTLNDLWLATFGKLLGGAPTDNQAGTDTWQQIPVGGESSSTTGTLPVALIAVFLLLGVGAYWYFNK